MVRATNNSAANSNANDASAPTRQEKEENKMKCTRENVEKVFKTILNQLEDDNGRGEFDDETNLTTAVETVIDWITTKQKENESEVVK